jgi:DNA-binding response OmpR family regulator
MRAVPETLPEAAGAPARPPRVLLAEDDHAFRAVVREALEADGYQVTDVATGRALLAALAEARALPDHPGWDLVLSDVRMPGLGGLDVLERHYAHDPDARFLLFTAFGDAATHARASEFGVEVLDKPFELDELLARARRLLDRQGPGAGGAFISSSFL